MFYLQIHNLKKASYSYHIQWRLWLCIKNFQYITFFLLPQRWGNSDLSLLLLYLGLLKIFLPLCKEPENIEHYSMLFNSYFHRNLPWCCRLICTAHEILISCFHCWNLYIIWHITLLTINSNEYSSNYIHNLTTTTSLPCWGFLHYVTITRTPSSVFTSFTMLSASTMKLSEHYERMNMKIECLLYTLILMTFPCQHR